ncbi:MAG: hydantoinase/oxoprolinase family protein [Gammaproteobacteria bacterium]|nr:hydantoinase/oxoprolinase family protein [Gammaproteobacteria bacterium]
MKRIRAATDVGGTFTDLVYYEIDEESGAMQLFRAEKAHTTPPDFEKGVLDTLEKAGLDYAGIEFFAHGTTVVINALTERKGARTGLITTYGFRDVLEIARGNRPDFFNLRYRKPEPFVPRYLRREVRERMSCKGEVLAELRLEDLPPVIEDFKTEGVEAVAICLLHSYANPDHEKKVQEKVRELWPEVACVASHQLSQEWREYERSNTTVLCAYVQPSAGKYLADMENALKTRGFSGSFYVMRSNGGIDTAASVRETPVTIVESGPASGVLGAASLGKLLGIENIIAFDVGGTTAKCSLLDHGRVSTTNRYVVERSDFSSGYPIMTPVVDIVEIGNGGGSIGWVDEHGRTHVGPRSAGALPGPVAYNRGGTEPTTTDANLLLERINPHYFIGGSMEPDSGAVRAALARLGAQTGMEPEEAARGMIRIANHNMVNALKLVSINRGYDPRDFTMVAFGGGGAMHAGALAAELNVPKVVVPAHCAVFSAWGMLMSDLRRDYVRTRPLLLDETKADEIAETVSEMETQACSAYLEEGIEADSIYFERLADMRYEGQEHTISVRLPSGSTGPVEIRELIDRFRDAYEREYTYRLDNEVEIVSYNLIACAAVDRPRLARISACGDIASAVKGMRIVDFDEHGICEATIFDRVKLPAGAEFSGPAIIEEAGSTTVLFPGQAACTDEYGNLHITIQQAAP